MADSVKIAPCRLKLKICTPPNVLMYVNNDKSGQEQDRRSSSPEPRDFGEPVFSIELILIKGLITQECIWCIINVFGTPL